jgi:hypothetical protein
LHRGIWLREELRLVSLRTSFMRFLDQVPALVLLLSCAFAQNPDSPPIPTSPPASTSAMPVSRLVELTPDASGTVPQEQIRELLRRVAEKDLENEKRLRDYTYIERQEEHRLDGHGQVKKVESRTWEILEIYGDPVERLMAKDDKPLSESEARKEEEKIQKVIDKRKNESEDERRKRLEKEEKAREEGRKFVLEVADAFTFRLAGSEALNGRDTWVLEAEPRPGYEPRGREAKVMSKFKGRIWIDKSELQWVKLDLTAIDTISFGWVVARIQKGAHLLIEQTRVNDEVWLPKYVQFHLDAKLALLKNIRADVEQTYRDYKKFRTDTKITVVGESRE